MLETPTSAPCQMDAQVHRASGYADTATLNPKPPINPISPKP